MGRIVFNPNVFAPGYVAPRIKREAASSASAWTSPQGVLTAAHLAKLASGLRLPSGLRDEGVDAAAEAMKHAATARADKKRKIEGARQATRDTRAEISKEDEPALTAEAEGMGADTLKLLRESREENEDKRFVATRVQAQKMIDAGDEDGAISLLAEAGDRVGVTTARMGSEARNRRGDAMKQTEARREKRRYATDDGTTLKYNRYDRSLPAKENARVGATIEGMSPEARAGRASAMRETEYDRQARKDAGDSRERSRSLSYDKLGSEAVSTGDRSEDVGSLFADAERLARGDVSSSTIDQGIMKDFRADLDSLKGDGSEEVQNLTREQLRGRLMRWKSGGKAAMAKGMAMAGEDMAEVNMMEELLHRQIRRRASLEAGVDRAPKTMTEGQEEAFTEESSERFMAERRVEDPYYGMRPEDAVKQIMVDAAQETSKPKQEKLRALMHYYTPKNQTFSDLFFDNTQERAMGNLRNLNRIMPEAIVEATELEKEQAKFAILEVVSKRQALESVPVQLRPFVMSMRKKVLEVKKLEQEILVASRGSRTGSSKAGDRLAKDLSSSMHKTFANQNNVPALEAEVKSLAKKGGININPGASEEDYMAAISGTTDPGLKAAVTRLVAAKKRTSGLVTKYDVEFAAARAHYARGNAARGDQIVASALKSIRDLGLAYVEPDLEALAGAADGN